MKIALKNLIVILILSLPLIASGQLNLQNQFYQTSDQLPVISTIALETNTSAPLTGQTVEITAKIFSTGETAGMIKFNWYKDNVFLIRESGQGKNKLTFTAQRAGINNEIKLIAELSNGRILERLITIKPIDLDLDWQAETYTDPLSGLKSFAAPRSKVKVTALPIFKDKTQIQNINYLWSLDGEVDTSQSGAGKQEFVFITSPNIGRSHEIELTAKNPGETIKTSKTIFIKISNPEALIYQIKEGDNLEMSFGYTAKPDSLLRFKAVPYSFSTKDFKNLNFEWRIAGKLITTNPERPDIITIKTAKEIPSGGISADLTLEIKNKNTLFQTARKAATITIVE